MLEKYGEFAKSALAIVAIATTAVTAATSVLAFVATVLYSYYFDEIWSAARDNLGLHNPKVIEVQEFSSYATEPVYKDQEITLNYTIRRTALGAACRIISAELRFLDETNIPIGGTILTRLRNFGTEYIPVQTRVKPDYELKSGRVRVDLGLLYNCNGTEVTDKMPTIVYRQLGD